MRPSLFRLVVVGLALIIGIGVSAIRRTFRRHQVGPSDSVAAQVNAQNAIQAREDKQAAVDSIDPYDIMVRGRYTHFDYAYSVLVPEGMVGATDPPGSPQHGFGIDLFNPTTTAWTVQKSLPRAYLYVDGSYNSAEFASVDDAVRESLKFLNEKDRQSRLLSKTPARLGGLHGARFVASYDEGGEAMIEDRIVAIRDKEIVYTIELTTPASRYARDKSLVTQMQKSWLNDPLPDLYPLPPVYEERK